MIDLNAMCMSFLMIVNQAAMFDNVAICPGVRSIPLEDLQKIACDGAACPIQAFYHKEDKIIYLSKELDYEDQLHRSILLHELVHYVQDVTGQWLPEQTDCRSGMRRELEAFRLQERYLLNNNIHIPVSQQMAYYRC